MSRDYKISLVLFCISFIGVFFYSHFSEAMNALHFLFLMSFSWAGYFYLLYRPNSITFKEIIYAAILFRVLAFISQPVMEDDYYRYLWNGYQLVEIGNVRTIPPIDFFTENIPEVFSYILSGINNPDLPSIYSPLTEYVFAAAYLIAPAKLWAVKLFYLLIEALAVIFAAKIFNPKQMLLFLWNPLLIFEVYTNAHPDILVMSFAVLSYQSFKNNSFFYLGIFMALAFCSRVFFIIAIPLLFVSRKAVISFLLTSIIIYGPFLYFEKSFGSLGIFLKNWEFNSSFYITLSYLFNSESARLICSSIFILFFIFFWIKFFKFNHAGAESEFNLDILFIVFFIFSSVFNPWYAVIFIPFIVLSKNNNLLWVTALLPLSYIHGLNLPTPELEPYQIPISVLIIEYTGIALCLYFSGLKIFQNPNKTFEHIANEGSAAS